MKPILFNTEMVRAIQANRKTVTRRVVKMPAAVTSKTVDRVCVKDGAAHFSWSWSEAFSGFDVKMPYRPGDILYVRETWAKYLEMDSAKTVWLYRADNPAKRIYDDNEILCDDQCIRWRPSIHMPREAARIFLRVTDVRVERLQDITEEQAVKEGFEAYHSDSGYYEPATLGFVETWHSTLKLADRALYGWDANPWVWVIEFERISREEAEDGLQRAD